MNNFSDLHKKEPQEEQLVSKKMAALERFERKNGSLCLITRARKNIDRA